MAPASNWQSGLASLEVVDVKLLNSMSRGEAPARKRPAGAFYTGWTGSDEATGNIARGTVPAGPAPVNAVGPGGQAGRLPDVAV